MSAKGDKIKIDTILLDMVLGKESSQIIKELQKNNIKDSIKEKLNEIGIAQDVQDMLWEVQAKRGSTKEKQIKETLIKSALGSDYEQVYNLLLSQAKSQENLLKALGFNKKVFDSTSSWQMYSPEMKLRQSRFNPVNFPFSYAEVESNPIYVAMLHHLISEARVLTNSFVDVFGKMGYIPAFCAEGYTHRLIFTDLDKTFLQYYYGLTDKPTKAYKRLLHYKKWLEEVQKYEKGMPVREANFIENNFQDYITVLMSSNLYELDKDEDFYEYAIVKFCNMCFTNPYWEKRNICEDDYITTDYSRRKIQRFMDISKENFVRYAKALKQVEFIGSTDSILDVFIENINAMRIYDDFDYNKELRAYLGEKVYSKTPLLYIDAPNFGEYSRFGFDSGKYLDLLESLIFYDGDWILSLKNYYYDRDNDDIEIYALKDFRERMKASERPLFEYKFLTSDRNVRNSISFITTIDFDELTAPEFKSKYNIKLKTNDTFKKLKVN